MVYRVIGTLTGSSLDGLDIAFVELNVVSGTWTYNLRSAVCYDYPKEWSEKLQRAKNLNALEYAILNAEYGEWCGEQINRFIAENIIQYQVQLIASHGHTVFHVPAKKVTAQLGSGAAIAVVTGINVVN